MMVDYHGVNKCIVPEIHPVSTFPCIDDTLSYAKPTIYSSIDLRAAFHTMKVVENSIRYTAFQTHPGQFEYTRSPFGIKSVPSNMCRLMALILSDNNGPLMKSALAYLDDVLCYSGSVEQHLQHLRNIFQCFRDSKMKLNLSKCNFLLPKIIFLSNLITPSGIGPDPDKVKAMLKYPVPSNQKKLKCALGMFQFYKKFIPSYSQMVVPLNRLLNSHIFGLNAKIMRLCL